MAAQRLLRGMTLGHYRTIRLVSRGGMGEVYEAVDQILERRAAIKIMALDHDQGIDAVSFLSMFTLEARTLALVDHPNVAQVYTVGNYDGAPYIAMEFVDGCSLREAIVREVLTTEQALSIFIPVFEALASLHQAEVVHRDIKPSNILIRRDGIVKIVDFGIAVRKGWEGTTFASELGTQDYAAPEVLRGAHATSQSDLWSAGAALFECLVGTKLSHHRPNPHAPLEFDIALCARIPAELRRIVAKLCMANPEARYKTGEEVAVELTKFYRLNFQGPIVLSYAFRENLRVLNNRLSALEKPVLKDEDRTVPIEEAIASLAKPAPVAPAPKRPEPVSAPVFESHKISFYRVYKLAKGLVLWGTLIFLSYWTLVVQKEGQRAPSAVVVNPSRKAEVRADGRISLREPAPAATFYTRENLFKVNLEWACKSGISTYYAQVARDPGFHEVTHARAVQGCVWRELALPAGSHYWRVRVETDPHSWSEIRVLHIAKEFNQ